MNTLAHYATWYPLLVPLNSRLKDGYLTKTYFATCFNKTYEKRKELLMSKKARSKTKSSSFSDYTFVNIDLPRSEKPNVDVWASKNFEDIPVFLDDLTTTGHKISMSYSDYNDAFTVSVTCNDTESVNYQKILSSKAGSSWDALVLTLYKVYIVCENGAWAVDGDTSAWG
jgi:hypothetical protein